MVQSWVFRCGARTIPSGVIFIVAEVIILSSTCAAGINRLIASSFYLSTYAFSSAGEQMSPMGVSRLHQQQTRGAT